MTKRQFLILHAIAIALALLILTNVWLAHSNQQLNNRALQLQNGINNARQAEAVLRQITLRAAQASDQEPDLRKLLVRHELKATLTVDGKKKEYP